MNAKLRIAILPGVLLRDFFVNIHRSGLIMSPSCSTEHSPFTRYLQTKRHRNIFKKAIPRIQIFLDTNFLFGVLNLHNNPQNEVSLELVALVRDQQLPFELYYHEESLVEMRATIQATERRLMRYAWDPSLSRAAIQTRSAELSGLDLKFHEANAKHQIEPSAFFMKYHHLERLLYIRA